MPTRAVIDIGTNSVKLLVAEVQSGCVDPLFEGSEQTRLGAGFYETHLLSQGAIQKTAEAVRAFAKNAERFSPVSLQVVATSAARDAINQGDLAQAILREAGLPLEVISGEHEADWSFSGVASQAELTGESLLVMDIGGGSTEVIVGDHGQKRAGRSFQVGTVRLLDKLSPSDPPTDTEREECLASLRTFFAGKVEPFLRKHLHGVPPVFVSSGGTASILGRMKWKLKHYDRAKIEGTVLSGAELAGETRRLWSLPLAERKLIPGLPGSRADVILMGAAILEAAAEALGFSEVRVSARGLRHGALLHAERMANG